MYFYYFENFAFLIGLNHFQILRKTTHFQTFTMNFTFDDLYFEYLSEL